MKLKDARYLSAEGQEALRYRVVNAIENGMSKSAICSGVSSVAHGSA